MKPRSTDYEADVLTTTLSRRGGRKASESSRGIGEDERQPVMARLGVPIW